MAETQNLGKLVVQMVLDPSRWQAGAQAVVAGVTNLVTSVTKAAATVNSALSPALDNATQAAEENAKATERMAGVWMDVNGKLRDASGKFVKDADVLKALGNTAGLTADQLKILSDRASQIKFEGASTSAKGLIEDMKGVAGVVGDVVTRGLQAATLAATGLAAASAVVGAAFEQRMRQVGVIAGSNAEQMAALTEEARRLGATTAFSASDAADAMQVLASAGLKTEEIIAATGKAMVLAGAGGTGLAQASSIVASTLAQFSLKADEAGRIADVFAQATADSQFSVGDLGEALKYGGPVAASFGLSLEETVAVMAQFRDLGLEGSMAGTALRSAFSQASQQTKTNSDTLAKYGLTLADVNPQLHGFSEILKTVGEKGMAASDAMVVFGVEAGGAVATLAEQAALGSTKLDDMTTSLLGTAAAGGTAQAMYEDMQKTVAGAFAELQSAGEEVLLTLYAQYGSALGDLLGSVTDFVNKVAVAIAERSGDIQSSLGTALHVIGVYLDEHGDELAQTFADGVAAVAQFTIGLANVATDLAGLVPILDDLAILFGTIWAASKVAAFASALSNVVSVISAAQMGVKALAVEMTVATGGTFALVVAIGTLAAGLYLLIDRYLTAKDAAEQLKSAQDALAGKRATEDAARVAALDAVLERQQAAIGGTEQELAASGKLTAAKKAELDILRDMTAESAARLEAEGKLVEVGGQLRTVASLVEDANLYNVADGYNAIEGRIKSLKTSAASTKGDIDDLTTALAQARKVQEVSGSDAQVAQVLRNTGLEVNTLAEAEAMLADLQARRKEATRQAVALENERGRVVGEVLKTEEQSVKDSEAEKLRARGETASLSAKAEKEYTDQTRDIRFKLQQELAGMEGILTDQIKVEMEARRREITQSYADQIEKAKGNSAEIQRLVADREAALTDLEEIEARKRAAVRAEREQQHADDVKAQRQKLQDKILAMEREGEQESVRLEREKAAAMSGIADANADLIFKIAEQYDKKIEAARAKELEAAQKDADALAQRHRDNAAKVAKAVVSAFSTAAQTVGQAMSGIYSILDGLVSKVLSLFETLTGFSFNLASLVDDVASAQSTAADEGTTLSTSDAASQVIGGLFSDASALLALFAEAAPVILKGLGAGLPALIAQFVEAVPTLLAAVLAEVPTIVGAVADALPSIVSMVVAALPDIANALLDVVDMVVPAVVAALPALLDGLISVAADLVLAVVQRLPDIVDGLLSLLPDLIRGVLAALPALIKAIIASAADIVVGLIKALPDLITAILDALPDILVALIEGVVEALPALVEALIEAVPAVVLALIGAVPDIIGAVLGQLPSIITMLIGMIPDIIVGIANALPELIPALVSMSGEIAAALVQAIPEIATALFWALVDLVKSVPDLALSIGSALVDAVKGAFDALVDAFTDILSAAWDALTSLFDSGDSDRKSRTASTARTAMGPLVDLATVAPIRVQAEPVQARTEERPRPAAGTTGQGSTARVQVVLNGRTIQDVLAVSDARGETTTRSARSSGGAQVGVSRGRFNRYSK